MKIMIDCPRITRRYFESLWMTHTMALISEVRHWSVREINTNKFNMGLCGSEEMSLSDHKAQSVLKLKYTLLFEKLGAENVKIRNLREFRDEYLSQVKSIWADHYRGINGRCLPMRNSEYQIMNEVISAFNRQKFVEFRRSCLAFFQKWKGRDISKIVKAPFRTVCYYVKNSDFESFYAELKRLMKLAKRYLFMSGFDPELKFMIIQ